MKKMIDDYPIFSHWFKALDWILDATEKFPKSVRFSVSSRVSNLSIDVMEDIIKAIYTSDRQMILKNINLNLEKLRIFFRICYKRKYISARQFEHISLMINETGRMTGGWAKKT